MMRADLDMMQDSQGSADSAEASAQPSTGATCQQPITKDHITALLPQIERIDYLVQTQLRQQQMRFALPQYAAQGLAIAEAEIEDLIASPIGMPRWAAKKGEAAYSEPGDFDAETRLGRLQKAFGLSPLECDVLLLSMLPLLDNRYSLLFSYMQDNTQRTRPTIEYILSIFSGDIYTKLDRQKLFLADAPLIAFGLLAVESRHGLGAGYWTDSIALPETDIFHFLIGLDALPQSISSFCHWLSPPKSHDLFCKDMIRQLQRCWQDDEQQQYLIGAFSGGSAIDRKYAAAEAAKRSGKQMLVADIRQLPVNEEDMEKVLATLLRQVRLHPSSRLLLEGLAKEDSTTQHLHHILGRLLTLYQVPAIYLLDDGAPISLPHMAQHKIIMRPLHNVEAYIQERAREGQLPLADNAIAAMGAAQLDLTTLDNVLREANAYRQLGSESDQLSDDYVATAVRHRTEQSFEGLAHHIKPRRGRRDIVLPDTIERQLDEIVAAAKHLRATGDVEEPENISSEPGVSVLLAGPPGVGKTLLAEILCHDTDMDLLSVDLSQIVNKYIGETEKRLARLFDLAQSERCALFFDEADVLFGKRSEPNDAKDRYANLETAYLLQRLERHSGLVLLATNNPGYLDPAFLRRFTFVVRMHYPDAAQRLEMWRQLWPQGISLAEDVDLEHWAAAAELSGANIRNITRLASWLAREQKTSVNNALIERAMSRELSKIGRLPLTAESVAGIIER